MRFGLNLGRLLSGMSLEASGSSSAAASAAAAALPFLGFSRFGALRRVLAGPSSSGCAAADSLGFFFVPLIRLGFSLGPAPACMCLGVAGASSIGPALPAPLLPLPPADAAAAAAVATDAAASKAAAVAPDARAMDGTPCSWAARVPINQELSSSTAEGDCNGDH